MANPELSANAGQLMGAVPLAQRAGGWILPATVVALAPALWLGSASSLSILLAIALLIAIAQVVWQDVTSYTIANGSVLTIGLIGTIVRLHIDALDVVAVVLDPGLCGGVIWLIREIYFRRRGHDGIGMGDVKLSAAGGLLVGSEGFAWALLLASLAALAFVAASRLREDPLTSCDKLPFGAFLAPALLVVWCLASCPAAMPMHP